MESLLDVVPDSYKSEVIIYDNYLLLGNITITDNEDVAIAIIDSQPNSIVVIHGGCNYWTTYARGVVTIRETECCRLFLQFWLEQQ